MAMNCVMCGAAISQGILCPKCDHPRRVKLPVSDAAVNAATTTLAPPPPIEASRKAPAFRPADESHTSFATFVRETVLTPLRALRDSMRAHTGHPLFQDAADTLDQVLSSLEMAPGVEELPPPTHLPTICEVVQMVANRFAAFAEVKGIRLRVTVPAFDETFQHHDQLADALGVLMDNSLHYVPTGGQVAIGVRPMEHKGNPILLFFVMDNGPLVPEHLRHVIFESGFVWNASAAERTGRGLFKVREFAVGHGGSVWIESKSGKTCTFFLRVSPDRARQ